MTPITLKYKFDTGNEATVIVYGSLLTPVLYSEDFEGISAKSMRSMIDHDRRFNGKPGVFIDNFPIECQECDDIVIHTSEYVEWLESELSRLQKENEELKSKLSENNK